ncbi:MAG TPA: MotA/TolQ/ExbB proton channel family protein, partial [Myxococcaceae bacterium]|nr:MotA/TolQ/ExbB proton channel family protein [Myxococcaceae bacterium]
MISLLPALTDLVIASAPHAAASGSFTDTVVKFFKDGGPFMFVNIFWMACALAVAVERI